MDGVSSLARRVQADRELTNLIRRKFAIKCTTGARPRRAGCVACSVAFVAAAAGCTGSQKRVCIA